MAVLVLTMAVLTLALLTMLLQAAQAGVLIMALLSTYYGRRATSYSNYYSLPCSLLLTTHYSLLSVAGHGRRAPRHPSDAAATRRVAGC